MLDKYVSKSGQYTEKNNFEIHFWPGLFIVERLVSSA